VFIHISELEKIGLKTLTEGQAVHFDEVRGREGKLKAANISLVN
jgi:cold shock CspA family protein